MRLLSSLVLAGLAAGIPAFADCGVPLAAAVKMYTVPYRMHSVTRGGVAAALAGGKPVEAEMVATPDKMYIEVKGHWRAIERPKPDEDDNVAAMKAGKVSCTKLRDEAVDGVPASVWQVDQKDDEDVKQQIVWIGDDSGLMLKGEFETDVGGDAGKSTTTIELSYSDATPPPGVN
ncbi:MAG: hypothetical protein U1E59_10875 [Amaricoccus sp.]